MKLALLTLLGLLAVSQAKHMGEPHDDKEDCDYCDDDFHGFGTPASKCGCCPWPCCCKCFNMSSGPGGECRSLIDMAFILDSSGSIGEADWDGPVKTFVNNVVGIFSDIGGDQQVAMVTYSTNATLEWGLGEMNSAEELTNAVNEIPLKGKFTNTVEGMEVCANQVFVMPDDRPEAPNVCLVMTDGRSNFRVKELPDMAKHLHTKCTVMAVGVTNEIDMKELEMIASRPDLVYTVLNFDALQTILEDIQEDVCPEPEQEEKCFCCCTPEQFFGGGGAYYYMK